MSEPRYAIIRDTANGRTWYQSTEAGRITRLRALVWWTSVRAEAEALAAKTGGHVVSDW